ncbi:MAG: cytochrome c oxidase subunit II [Gaiellaceae bacterium]
MLRRRPLAAAGIVGVCLLLAGCGSRQSTLDAQGGPERAISHLFWVLLAGCTVGFAVVVFLLYLGWLRRNRTQLPFGGGDTIGTSLVVGLGVVLPLILLPAAFAYSDFFVLPKTEAPQPSSTRLTVEVTGHQWFWTVSYPGTRAVTANEIHIPTRTRVDVVVHTSDVIHSFWVPQLNRKIDTIPGRSNRVLLIADRPGRYRGSCTEYCGVQHAHMSLYVIAQPQAQFRAWLANMAKPAAPPAGAQARRGEKVFLENACAGCHQIRGTAAHGTIGPDLTHLATRQTLAAVTIPNRPGYLGGWILDPQHVKPGNKMPALNLSGPDFRALLAYLDGLR